MNRMTEEELKAIEDRANAATPGPWRADDAEDKCGIWAHPYDAIAVQPAGGLSDHPEKWPVDRKFIAHAREDIPKLLAELRRVTEERDGLRAALKSCAESLEEDVRGHHGVAADEKLEEMHPVSVRRFNRDMAPVREARAALSRYPEREKSGHEEPKATERFTERESRATPNPKTGAGTK